ncbi:MAG: hypothetical protein KGL39_45595 [Patescibacteria group bacterium]|nr:hypothetical protein [Patescibacteria group bacterium]
MTRAEIAAFFPQKEGVQLNFGASSYAVPTLAWLQGDFWNYFYRQLWDESLQKWTVRWECRDFARAYACMAQLCWAKTQGAAATDDGLAVGEFWFIPDATKPTEGHAICAVFTENGLQFIDPQVGTSLWQMSHEQFSSSYFLRF